MMGRFQDFIIISFLIIIHEIGHFIAAKSFGFQTDRIYIYPLGGISRFFLPINCNPFVELVILIMGPLFQQIACFLLCFLFPSSVVLSYHIGILSFNLLPIYPLDGGKIFHLFVNIIFPIKTSWELSIILSYFVTIVILFLNNTFSFNMVLTYVLLIHIIHSEEMKIELYYQKFLIERLFFDYFFCCKKKITSSYKFYRYYKNIIRVDNDWLDEKIYLQKKYCKFDKNC